MKHTLKFINLLVLALILTTSGCSNDDDAVVANVTNLQDLEVTIDENPTNGQALGTIQSNATTTLSFTIDSQSPANALNIDTSTGELTVADATLFDYEVNTVITATISATGAVNTATVTININNVVELDVQDFTTTVDENPTNGDALGTVQATGDSTLSYSITSQAPAGAISIDVNTGELTVADATIFDFETNPTITADILVDNSGTTETITATITLNNVNELSIQDFTANVDENSVNGTVLGTVQASGDGTLSYSITSETPAGAVSINSNTGELTIADETLFDFEANTTITLDVSVDNTVNTETAIVTINLNNINELGDFNHGGIIFWLDPTSNNSSGLVVALDGQSGSTSWGCDGTFTGATGTAIGTGASNTAAAVAAGCASPGSAIELVSNLNLNGFDDWFLPSVDEWNEVDANFNTIIGPAIQANGGGSFSGTIWSSTEVSSANAFVVFIGGTNPLSIVKFGNFPVRAIRAF